ncbi:PREDICTED: PI-PLC X domain-containing protein At5g67130-like [Erythranthe guttata]|uniref:PI-PLC X domain-containing protein At5g67130-like n=1 Tax=Erythranthe guttata TaxID=4155 RepID=UPI00064DFB15|nr:PREDICTED: PI-PLC X domain-containing protein At5g67130-like [Erythranthe guttata]|eukprot:XP_012855273.1 PREDICTED: PI-PLC X domain-containing protein At5g67130-like [Erythranthe guttata]
MFDRKIYFPITAAGLVVVVLSLAAACSNGTCGRVMDECSSDEDCGSGLYCFSCEAGFPGSRCNNSLPFNKYAFLATHNSFAIEGEPSHTGVPRITPTNQEDTITQQLNNGVRGLMLDIYDYEGDIWLCHSFGGRCRDFTAFGPAIDTLKEIEAFMRKNPTEIVTLILQDYVQTPNGLTKVLKKAGLMNYQFPLSKMPRNGENWPLVKEMVAKNQRLLIFTSVESKQKSEGIAYQWNYIVETLYGDNGMTSTYCVNREESSRLNDTSKSLVLVNYFGSLPSKKMSCIHNSEDLRKVIETCHRAAGERWPNFLAVDFYKRSEGGGPFQAVDALNGELACGRKDVFQCARRLQEKLQQGGF